MDFMDNVFLFIFFLTFLSDGNPAVIKQGRKLDAIEFIPAFNSPDNPDEKKEFPDGDVVIGDEIIYWPDGIVYFAFVNDSNVKNIYKRIIWSAMEEFHLYTCVRFEESETRTNKLYIMMEGETCFASLGKKDNRPIIVIGKNCLMKGVIIHQLMHVLGFLHENNRMDRDKYVTLNGGNIREGQESVFAISKLYGDEAIDPYDYSSITHFSRFAYAQNNQETLTPRQNKVIGQRNNLSIQDVVKIRRRYGCSLFCPADFGVFAHPYDCNKFIMCSHFSAHEMNCSTKQTYYDPETKQCEWEKPKGLRCNLVR